LMATGAGRLPQVYAPWGFVPARWPGTGGTVSRLAEAGALRAGMVAAHCVHVDDAEAVALAGAGVGVALCPVSNRRLRCGRAPLERLRAAGAAIGLGTDSPASAGDFDLRAEARELAEQAAAAGEPLAAGALVELITAGSARALGREREVGALGPGLRADLCAVSLHGPLLPLADADPAAAALDPRASVAMVAVDGRVLLDGGRPVLVDAEAIEARAARARKRLC
jgi:5-methylthioadenosine/S-adenosylhomocysteine deaminase